MKGSEKKLCFSSPPIKSSASPKGADENDRSNQGMGLNLQNPKKQAVKNFMSPTVSAVSKATSPRKKILAERNESPGSNFSNTHLSKIPNIDSKPSPKTIPKASQKNSPNLDPKVTSKEPFSQKTPLSFNSRDKTPSPGPYDPLTNYLSPRPQFLRYNPSRRKEIFFRLEMEHKEGDDGLSVSSTASFDSKNASGDEADTVCSDNSFLASSSSQEDEEFGDEIGSLLEQEDEEFDIGSDDEAEEEVGWSLRGVLKYMLLLVVLVLTTSYISSMNSPTSARAFEGLTLGYQKIQNHSYGIVEGVEVGYDYKFLDGKQEQLGLLGFNQAIVDEGIEEEMAENVNRGEIVSLELEDRNVESVEMVEEVKKDGKGEDACEEELIKSGKASDQFAEDVELQEKETMEKIEVEKAEYVKENGESEDVIGDELVKTGKVYDQLVEVLEDIELQEREETGEQIEDVEEYGESRDVIEEELMESGEVSDQMVRNIELLGQETAGEIEFLQGHEQASLLPEGTDHQEASSHTTDSSEKERVVPKEAGEEIHKKTRYNDMIRGKIIRFGNAISMASALTMLEKWGKSVVLNFEEVNPLKGLNQHMGTEILLKVIFGFLACTAIVASLVFGSNIRRKRIASKHSTKPVVKEKPSLVLPAERAELVNSFLNTTPLISSVGKDIKETYQSRAPSVELLGEFEVGGISSSLKSSCAIKSRMKDEVSSYPDFLEKGLGSKAYSAPVQDQRDFSEFSTMNSNLSETLTAKKKLLRKEFGNNDMAGAKGEEMNNLVTTPLRRSARLRTRADVASP